MVVGVAERYLCFKVLEVKSLEDDFDDFHHADELFLHLVGTAEDVGIVLGERTHTGQAVELAALLVTVHRAELSAAERQVLIGTRLPLEDHAVVRAVHGLQQVLLAFFRRGDRAEAVFAVVIPVT